ncbi:MAG: hypothetical protein JW722_08300 [Demequinaceae bacterium]|nr:hypothetical protein [Demequinaceae bacterium]
MLYSDGTRARLGDSVRIDGRQYAQIVAIIDNGEWSNDNFYRGFNRWRDLDSGVLLWLPIEPDAMIAGDHGRIEHRPDLLGDPAVTRILKGPRVIDSLPVQVGPRDEVARYRVEFADCSSPETRVIAVVTTGGDYKAMALAAIAVRMGKMVNGSTRYDARTNWSSVSPQFNGPVTITNVERTFAAQPGDVVDRFSGKPRKHAPKTEVVGRPGEWGSPNGPVPRYTFGVGIVGETDVREIRVKVSQGAGRAAAMAAESIVFGTDSEGEGVWVTRRLPGLLIESIGLVRVEWQYRSDGDELFVYNDVA